MNTFIAHKTIAITLIIAVAIIAQALLAPVASKTGENVTVEFESYEVQQVTFECGRGQASYTAYNGDALRNVSASKLNDCTISLNGNMATIENSEGFMSTSTEYNNTVGGEFFNITVEHYSVVTSYTK
jgi:hypothetical protein